MNVDYLPIQLTETYEVIAEARYVLNARQLCMRIANII